MSDIEEEFKWPIRTVYYLRREVVHVNAAKHANSAVERAVGHMQIDDYGASACEVFDHESGKLHAVLTNARVNGKLEMRIVYKREPQKPEGD